MSEKLFGIIVRRDPIHGLEAIPFKKSMHLNFVPIVRDDYCLEGLTFFPTWSETKRTADAWNKSFATNKSLNTK